MAGLTEYYPQFFTATILEWKHLLKPDKYKNILTNSLDFLVSEKRAAVYGFVVMPNHMHLIWHICEGHKSEDVQRDFASRCWCYHQQHLYVSPTSNQDFHIESVFLISNLVLCQDSLNITPNSSQLRYSNGIICSNRINTKISLEIAWIFL